MRDDDREGGCLCITGGGAGEGTGFLFKLLKWCKFLHFRASKMQEITHYPLKLFAIVTTQVLDHEDSIA